MWTSRSFECGFEIDTIKEVKVTHMRRERSEERSKRAQRAWLVIGSPELLFGPIRRIEQD
jgi:hypothetical protein